MDLLAVELRSRPPYERLSSNASFSDRGPPPGDEEIPLSRAEPKELQKPPDTPATLRHVQQSHNLWLKFTLRWIVSLIFAALIVATLKIYERKRNFSPNQKTTFNTVITALILGLSLNLFVSATWLREAFKESARVLRWRILADKTYSERQQDLILGMENLLNVCKLGWQSRGKPAIWLVCLLWLLFNLLAQVSVALVSLTFSVDDGKTYNDTYFTDGLVRAPNMTHYFWRRAEPLAEQDSLGLAHNYGESYQNSSGCGPYSQFAKIYDAVYDPPYFCQMTGKAEFTYRFKEYNRNDTERTYPSLTNRTITASSGQCSVYKEETNHPTKDDFGIEGAATLYTFSNSTETIKIPTSHRGWAATTYVFRGHKLPQRATGQSCGDRCLWIWALRFGDQKKPKSTLFQCPITVSEVKKTTSEAHEVPDAIALVAAASIAMQGRWSGSINDKHWTQYQFYPWNTRWDTYGHKDAQVGINMAEFAIRTIAAMAEQNPRIDVEGRVPHLGSRLNVSNHWRYTGVLLACIVGAQFLLFVGTAWTSRSVVVVKDSHLAIARWLGSGKMEDEAIRRPQA
ncbi:MAG: hypothetical protein Q9210_003853 [Variospora velana]